MKKKAENEMMVSMNSTFPEFGLQKLEERLETDPLAISGLLDLDDVTLNAICEGNYCPTVGFCERYSF